MDFCRNASIPGVKYIVETKRSFIERSLWCCALLLSLTFCFVLMVQTLLSWVSSPVILAMDRSTRSVWDVPFPAVTVCPISKVRGSMFKFTDIVTRMKGRHNVSIDEHEMMSQLALQCENIPKGITGMFKNASVVDNIEEYSFDLESLAVYVSFRNVEKEVNVMKKLLTEEGLCYTFNMLPHDHLFTSDTFHYSRDYLRHDEVDVQWSISGGYPFSAGLNAYPYRVLGAGTKESLRFVFKVEKQEIDDWCSKAVRGFKVALHSPAEFPRPRQQAVLVPLDMEMQLGVRAQEVRADAAVRSRYSPAQRRCLLPRERSLRFFRLYTQASCELECLANATRQACGCVEFHMPRDLDTLICGAEKLECCQEVANYVQALAANMNGAHFEVTKHFNASSTLSDQNCNCLPICSQLSYDDGRTSLSSFDYTAYEIMRNTSSNDSHYVRVIIYFKSSRYIPMLRIEHYNTLTLIANCGGILGLCLGMSVLSIAELIYWLLIRPWTYHRPPDKQPSAPKCATIRKVKPSPSVFLY